MSVNSSSIFNNSRLPPSVSSSSSSLSFYMFCLRSKPTSFIYAAFSTIVIFLLLPLCIFILHHGLQQWKQKRSTSSAATMSHSDCFTYNVVAMELIGILGYMLCFTGGYKDDSGILKIGILLLFYIWYGEMFFHILTCVERYLAVVHPVTYLNLRNERGIRFRNIIVGCVWLLCFVGMGMAMVEALDVVFSFCILISSLTVVCFCSFSVLCVLIRPGPGDLDPNKDRVDSTKQRAFHTMLAISTVLLLRFMWGVVWFSLSLIKEDRNCITILFDFWFITPSSLVLPLLYLHRVGKLACSSIPCFVKK